MATHTTEELLARVDALEAERHRQAAEKANLGAPPSVPVTPGGPGG
jgi:hypothetical protein